MARATMLVAIDDEEITYNHINATNSGWIDIKVVMLKHFLPEDSVKL